MKTYSTTHKRGFTLVELMVAMAITSILVFIIVGLTYQGLDVWKSISEDISTSARARVAMQTISQDLEAIQWQRGNDFQWFYAGSEKSSTIANKDITDFGPKGLQFANASRLIFFTSAADRSAAVSSSEDLRSNYRSALSHDLNSQGDINAVGYKLSFRDQILNLPGSKSPRIFPLYTLCRQLISPRDAYDYLMGQNDLKKAYARFALKDDEHFLVENIIEMTLSFDIEYTADKKEGDLPKHVKIPIISATSGVRHASNEIELFGDHLNVKGGSVGDISNGRIISANLSITVVTEDGMAYANLVRMGKRRPPRSLQDFFAKYTRSFAREIMIRQAQ